MANKIDDLTRFQEAVYSELEDLGYGDMFFPSWFADRCSDILLDKINEAEYINQWVKE